ncbi:8-amino-7-oxononanoate synthase [Hypoxylon rubiginosum]|uniref:8-amino-7-oxononanoate synthase n=1 Tax=Hypoxylon rubiginosum TaxID=110542 RepID=A0ACC0CSI3_9PEZI|nr:8-amino-7-oxononanoate synthase [Hypoxylon rubiginosum]
MYTDVIIKGFIEDQRLRSASMNDGPAFYRNLEKALDTHRRGQTLLGLKPRWPEPIVDFTTDDTLSLSKSGRVREGFLAEVANHPDFDLSSSGSRVQYGNYSYLNQVEQEIADFHGSEIVYITQSGFAANVAVLSGVPLPGDAVVYDELVHASTHEGLHLSLAAHKLPFRHNDPDALREVLISLKSTQPLFASGSQSVLICVESVYSMDGDVCLLEELLQVSKEVFPLGNAQFLVDEAHSLGTIGPSGKGLVSLLGLEKEIAIRVHVASKAIASVGGLILCNKAIRYMLLNNARSILFSSAPPFPMVAAIRAGYKLLMTGETQEAQEKVQSNVKHFFRSITATSIWEEATNAGILSIPLLDDWEEREFQTQIVPVRTQPGQEKLLFLHLLTNDINAYPMSYPVVPKGESRIRLIFHAHNTTEQIDKLAATICDWARDMLDVKSGKSAVATSRAAMQLHALQSAISP